MLASDNVLSDPKVWISGLALLVSICSAFFSWRSGRNAARALAISENQEKRRQPQLGVYLVVNGFRRLLPKRQLFGFLVSISNPTDINNSVARAELKIAYLIENDVSASCRIQHNPTLGETIGNETASSASVFALPLRVDAHQTVSGWFVFSLDNDVIGKGTVDGHSLVLEDTHGISTETDPIMVREWTDETKND
jgi:hypothetical protein